MVGCDRGGVPRAWPRRRPTTGDIGLTWDEPAYRFSQLRSEQWWGRLIGAVRSATALEAECPVGPRRPALLLDVRPPRDQLPPAARRSVCDVLTHAVFGHWMKEIPSRRIASVLELCLTITLGFGSLARRYGVLVGR